LRVLLFLLLGLILLGTDAASAGVPSNALDRAVVLALKRQAAPPRPTTTPPSPSPGAPTAPAVPAVSPASEAGASLSISAWAGPVTATSLAELLAGAIRNSPELASARLDIEIAEGRILEATARDDWQLGADVSVGTRAGQVGGLSIPRQTSLSASGQLTRLLPTCGAFTLSAGSSVVDGDMRREWIDTVTVALSRPLWRNRGRDISYAALTRATLQRDATRLSHRVSAISVVQSVIAAYWELVLAEQEVAIAETSLGLAEERLRLTRAGIKGGKVADAEALAVEQAIATRTEELLGAELAIVDRSIALRRATGLPIGDGALVLRVDAAISSEDRGWELGALLERAYAASPELARLAVDQKTTEIDVEVTREGLLPQLDAALTLGPSGRGETAYRALQNLVTIDDYEIGGTLTYRQSLGSRDVRGRLRSARGQLEKIKVSSGDVKQQLAQALSRAIGQLELARRRIALAERTIELSQRNIEVELTRFGLGKSTNFDVLQRQDELKQARLRRVRALIDWRKAEATVMALTGELLPFYGITLPDR
jgi:outer membrane protein